MYEVDQTIIAKAINCDKNHVCLTEEIPSICKVSSCVGCKIHFLKKLERDCPYHQEFGFSYICKCPVRMEIYDKYKI